MKQRVDLCLCIVIQVILQMVGKRKIIIGKKAIQQQIVAVSVSYHKEHAEFYRILSFSMLY